MTGTGFHLRVTGHAWLQTAKFGAEAPYCMHWVACILLSGASNWEHLHGFLELGR